MPLRLLVTYSFIQAIFIEPLQVHYYSDTVSKFHAEALQATASEGLAQGPYMAARAEFEPTTLWTKGDESTNEPPGLISRKSVPLRLLVVYFFTLYLPRE